MCWKRYFMGARVFSLGGVPHLVVNYTGYMTLLRAIRAFVSAKRVCNYVFIYMLLTQNRKRYLIFRVSFLQECLFGNGKVITYLFFC